MQSIDPILDLIREVRPTLSPAAFRSLLRNHLLNNPSLTLQNVATALNVSRQKIGALAGPLGRPNCATPGPHPAPRRDQARRHLAILAARVKAGEPAVRVARDLGISLVQATRLGFRARQARPLPFHGTADRFDSGCRCWRCRRGVGIAMPRAGRTKGAIE